jgi:hypothetical protein
MVETDTALTSDDAEDLSRAEHLDAQRRVMHLKKRD